MAPGEARRGLIQTECGAPPAWPWRPLTPIMGRLGIQAAALVGIPAAAKDRSERTQDIVGFLAPPLTVPPENGTRPGACPTFNIEPSGNRWPEFNVEETPGSDSLEYSGHRR